MAQTNAKNDVTLEIDALSYGPYGIGRLDGKAVMIPDSAPGDRVRARIVAARANYSVAESVELLEKSPLRREPPCVYARACGGCTWQHVSYAAQLDAKQKCVFDALTRIGKLSDFDLRRIGPSPAEFHYRRRIRLQVDAAKRLGYYARDSHDLIAIDTCAIAFEKLNRVLEPVRQWLENDGAGIAEIELVAGDWDNELVLVASAAAGVGFSGGSGCDRLLNTATAFSGIIVKGNGRRNVWGDSRVSVVTEADIVQLVEADIFTQIHPQQNRALLHYLLGAAVLESSDRVLELYCGAGNFTLSIAKRAAEVVAVEGDARAVAGGRANASHNGIHNIQWRLAPVPAAVARAAERKERFGKIILDPPRAGAKGLARKLAALGAQTIIYVSCNPATLARDLAALAAHGYKLGMVQPIDLFPQTFHVETLAVLRRR